jgi:hypothetical protein
LEKVDDDSLRKEKDKLMNKDGFVILEYIRSSIEIIMSLKIEDLEKDNPSKPVTKEAGVSNTGSQTVSSLGLRNMQRQKALKAA